MDGHSVTKRLQSELMSLMVRTDPSIAIHIYNPFINTYTHYIDNYNI